jgi:hypothetical protein
LGLQQNVVLLIFAEFFQNIPNTYQKMLWHTHVGWQKWNTSSVPPNNEIWEANDLAVFEGYSRNTVGPQPANVWSTEILH